MTCHRRWRSTGYLATMLCAGILAWLAGWAVIRLAGELSWRQGIVAVLHLLACGVLVWPCFDAWAADGLRELKQRLQRPQPCLGCEAGRSPEYVKIDLSRVPIVTVEVREVNTGETWMVRYYRCEQSRRQATDQVWRQCNEGRMPMPVCLLLTGMIGDGQAKINGKRASTGRRG